MGDKGGMERKREGEESEQEVAEKIMGAKNVNYAPNSPNS